MDSPRLYLSVSTSPNGRREWRCIYGGSPVCRDGGMLDAVHAYARFARKGDPCVDDSVVWDGDTGEFVPLASFPTL